MLRVSLYPLAWGVDGLRHAFVGITRERARDDVLRLQLHVGSSFKSAKVSIKEACASSECRAPQSRGSCTVPRPPHCKLLGTCAEVASRAAAASDGERWGTFVIQGLLFSNPITILFTVVILL